MRLAVSPTTPGIAAPELVRVCASAERLGYDAAWLAEVAGPEAFSLAGAVAAGTSRMDVGVAVVAAATRTPAVMAMGAGTVSQLLEGRTFSLGIGSSSQLIVESWHGSDFSPPLQRVREAVEATRAALAGAEYAGEHAGTSRFRLAAPPAGPVRLVVGALGPRMLRLAGAVGDGVCLNLMPPEAVSRQLAEVRRGAEEAGRDLPDDFEVMGRFHVVLGPPDQGRQVIRSAFGPYFAQPVYNRFLGWLGYEEEAARLAEGFARGDRGAVAGALHDDIVDGVALVGEPEHVGDRLTEYAEAGVGVAALNVIAPDAAGVLVGLEALAG
jgi:probable F420-dependent oxidoreductase